MKRKYYFSAFRSMRHAAEKRAYYANPEYVRAKRNPKNLCDPWDDYSYTTQKTWKVKRKTQYYGRKELNEYVAELSAGFNTWEIEYYFDSNMIGYRLQEIKKSKTVLSRYDGKEHTFYYTYKYILTYWHTSKIELDKI